MGEHDPVTTVLQIFEWASGLLSTIALGIAGLVFARAGADRARMESRFDKLETDMVSGDRALWEADRESERIASAFRERIAGSMVTKADLRDFEQRLTAVVRSESRRPRPPAEEEP